jgi:hypothetical protein
MAYFLPFPSPHRAYFSSLRPISDVSGIFRTRPTRRASSTSVSASRMREMNVPLELVPPIGVRRRGVVDREVPIERGQDALKLILRDMSDYSLLPLPIAVRMPSPRGSHRWQ